MSVLTGGLLVGIADPDLIDPTAPTNLIPTAELITSATLNWTASTDNVGVVGYQVVATQIAGTP